MDIAPLLWLPLAIISMGAGYVGSLLGLGGGFIIVPVLTLLFGLDLRSAVGASLIAVVATSSGSSVTYLKKSYSNVELASFLEISTVSGAIASVFLADKIPHSVLYLCFAAMLVLSSSLMLRQNIKSSKSQNSSAPINAPIPAFTIPGSFVDQNGTLVEYHAHHLWTGFGISGIAGLLSGLLGIGGGVIKVPTMNLVMGVPIKAASATSNLMIGMTAATTAVLMFVRGEIPLQVASIVAIGIYMGARLGSRKMHNSSSRSLSWTFFIFALFIASQMVMKGLKS